jgi:hypothetical protein
MECLNEWNEHAMLVKWENLGAFDYLEYHNRQEVQE